MTHNELAARIERAEGPDIALDCEVAIALNLAPAGYERAVVWGEPRPYWWDRSDPKADYWSVPAYTGSLDAAMQLIPEGWHVYEANFGDPTRGKWYAQAYVCILPYQTNDAGWATADGARDGARAATPALALCAAALRARSAS